MSHLSTINTGLTEDYLRFEQEGKFLERKGRDTKPTHIANELIGMLNSGGGVLVYGITDDGRPESIANTELIQGQAVDIDQYLKIVHDFIKPPANIEIEEIYLSGGELIIIYHVEPTFEAIYSRPDNENVYLRVADSNKGPLNRNQVAKLEYNRGIRKYEDELQPDFNIEDLDRGLCEEYCRVMNVEGPFEELAYKRALCVKRNGVIVYKNAAILLFCQNPERYIPNASVRYLRYDGKEQKSGSEFNVIKDQRFEGPIPQLIRVLTTHIEASLRDYYYLDIQKGKFLKIPEFPKDAWLEGVVNALYHRSYNITGSPIMICHFDDRIEISNSGPLPAQVTVDNIKDEKFTRNVRIARTLNDLGYVRELNEGVKRMYKAMQELMLASPEYRQQNNTVFLTLRNRIAEHKETISSEVMEKIQAMWKELNITQQEIINYLAFDQVEATLDDFSLKIEISEQAVRNNLKTLMALNIIEKLTDKKRDRNALYRFNTD